MWILMLFDVTHALTMSFLCATGVSENQVLPREGQSCLSDPTLHPKMFEPKARWGRSQKQPTSLQLLWGMYACVWIRKLHAFTHGVIASQIMTTQRMRVPKTVNTHNAATHVVGAPSLRVEVCLVESGRDRRERKWDPHFSSTNFSSVWRKFNIVKVNNKGIVAFARKWDPCMTYDKLKVNNKGIVSLIFVQWKS